MTELDSLPAGAVADQLEECSTETVEQLFNLLICRLDALAETAQSADPVSTSAEYERVNALLDQVQARRGFRAVIQGD